MLSQGVSVPLVLVGDGSEVSRCKVLVQELGITDDVFLLGLKKTLTLILNTPVSWCYLQKLKGLVWSLVKHWL